MLDGRVHPGVGVPAAAAPVLIGRSSARRRDVARAARRRYFSVFAQRKPMPGARAVATWW